MLGLSAFTAMGPGSIPGQGNKIHKPCGTAKKNPKSLAKMSVTPPVWTTASGSDELQLLAQLLTPPWPRESEHSITRPHCLNLPNEQHTLWAVTGIVAQTEEISRSHLAKLKKKIRAGKVSMTSQKRRLKLLKSSPFSASCSRLVLSARPGSNRHNQMIMSGEKKESVSGGLRNRLQSTLMVKIDFHQLTLQATVLCLRGIIYWIPSDTIQVSLQRRY